MCEFLSNYYIPWIIGLGYSVVVGHLAISPTMRILWRGIGLNPDSATQRPHSWQPAAQGFVERALFTVAIVAGFAAFIAAWLVLKTASQWSAFIRRDDDDEVNTHAVHVNYVLGTGLSIAFAAAGAFMIELLEGEDVRPAILVGLGTVAAAIALGEWVAFKAKTIGYLDKPMRWFR